MLPFLPPEIVLNVIRLSLPPVQYLTFRERYRMLLAYSLVNRCWRSLAQGELFERVWLPDAAWSTMRLSDALEGTGSVLARRVKTLHFGGSGFSEITSQGPWKLCSGLVEVQAKEVCLPLDCLADMTSLRQLHLHNTEFEGDPISDSPDPPPPPFKLLEHLSISDPWFYDDDTFSNLLRPSVFPALHSVLLAESYSVAREEWGEDFVRALTAIASQIRSLAIIDSSGTHELEEAILPRLRFYTALEHLVIVGRPEVVNRPDIYTGISTPLTSLSIIVHPHEPADPQPTLLNLLSALRRNVPSLRQLRHISIPQQTFVLDDKLEDLVLGTSPWVELRLLAAAREIVLDESEEYREMDAWLPAWKDLIAGSSCQ